MPHAGFGFSLALGGILPVGYKSMAIVMAAGKGTRMMSDLPKVLVPVRQRPMIAYVLDTLDRAEIEQIVVVVGYRAADVQAALAGRPRIEFTLQSEQLGTGHAVMMCREQLAQHDGPVLVVAGDSPLMQADSILALFEEFEPPAGRLSARHRLQRRSDRISAAWSAMIRGDSSESLKKKMLRRNKRGSAKSI